MQAALSPLFLDLAMILITAGLITVLFKKLRQPLVLGYIVAGFFIGPYFPWFPVVTDQSDVKVWSDIGVVFLMFAVGLEFNLKKFRKVVATGGITALTELFVMFLVGSTLGRIMGWSSMDSIFLGCMLSISSTAIIIKSVDDLGLRQQKFASTATGVLVVEDLVAVLLLVLLSTVAAGSAAEGSQIGSLGMSLLKLVFFITVWFLFGIYIVPSILRWMRRYTSEETLCIVAVGLCFAMVVFASYVGFSTALGAFVMGAILAETVEADAIHRIITPIKNLFSAVFFVSVGMLVDPAVLAHYWLPIVLIALTVIVVKSASATAGIILSGQSPRDAFRSGVCFCQIGEFSFVIAQLGLTYGVINPDLYPIIVAVSIVTTFATPYMIKGGQPIYEKVYPKFPRRIRGVIEDYTARSHGGSSDEGSIRHFVLTQVKAVVIYGAILLALLGLSRLYLEPLTESLFGTSDGPSWWGRVIGLTVTLVLMAPFLWALVIKDNHKEEIKTLLETYEHSEAVIIPILLFKSATALMLVGFSIGIYTQLAVGLVIVAALMVVLFVMLSRRVRRFYHRIESKFMSNLNQRQSQNSFKIPQAMADNFLMDTVRVTPYSQFVGKTLQECAFRQHYGINVVASERAGKVTNLPGRDERVMPLDKLTVIGAEDKIAHLRADIEVEPDMLIHDHSDNEVNIYRYEIKADGPMCGKDLVRSEFQKRHNGMIIAIERGGDFMHNPPAQTVFQAGDVVWFVSPEDKTLSKFNEEE